MKYSIIFAGEKYFLKRTMFLFFNSYCDIYGKYWWPKSHSSFFEYCSMEHDACKRLFDLFTGLQNPTVIESVEKNKAVSFIKMIIDRI